MLYREDEGHGIAISRPAHAWIAGRRLGNAALRSRGDANTGQPRAPLNALHI